MFLCVTFQSKVILSILNFVQEIDSVKDSVCYCHDFDIDTADLTADQTRMGLLYVIFKTDPTGGSQTTHEDHL